MRSPKPYIYLPWKDGFCAVVMQASGTLPLLCHQVSCLRGLCQVLYAWLVCREKRGYICLLSNFILKHFRLTEKVQEFPYTSQPSTVSNAPVVTEMSHATCIHLAHVSSLWLGSGSASLTVISCMWHVLSVSALLGDYDVICPITAENTHVSKMVPAHFVYCAVPVFLYISVFCVAILWDCQ